MKHSVIRPSNRLNFNPFIPTVHSSVATERVITTKEALVVDIITNDSHPEYASDGYNIGAIKFRIISTDSFRPEETLNWALPAEANFSEYPLLSEIVIVFVSMHRWYYHRRLNISTGVVAHAAPGLHIELSQATTTLDDQRTRTTAMNGTPTQITAPNTTEKLGKFFKSPEKLYRLRHDEGDIVLQGRLGQSIRFGAAWKAGTIFQSTGADQQPNLLLRVGQNPEATPSVNTPYGLVSEDINKDASSLFMVSDQLIPLVYSTKDASIHQKSIANFPKRLEGKQIVLNTDRVVLNAKMGKIMGFALDGVHWTSSKDFSVDANQDYLSQITRNLNITIGGDAIYNIGGAVRSTASSHSFIAAKNYLGSVNDESEPIPAGTELAIFLTNFLLVFLTNPEIVLSTSPPGAPSFTNPKIIQGLQDLYNNVQNGPRASFNSRNSFTVK